MTRRLGPHLRSRIAVEEIEYDSHLVSPVNAPVANIQLSEQSSSIRFLVFPRATSPGRMRRRADAVASSAQRVSAIEPCKCWSDISGGTPERLSEASDRSGPIGEAGLPDCIANSSKTNGMRVIGAPFRVWHECCLGVCKRSDSSKANDARGRSYASQHSIFHLERQAIPPAWHCALSA